LENIRKGIYKKDDFDFLNKKLNHLRKDPQEKDIIHLYSTNKSVE